jgi:hypothetical protein
MEWWLPGAGERSLMSFFNEYRVLVLQDTKCWGDWVYNSVKVLSTAQLYTKNSSNSTFYVCAFYRN